MRLLRQSVSLALLWLVTVAAYAQGADPNSQGDWAKIVDGARKEGALVVSIPASAELRKTLDENFKEKNSRDSISIFFIICNGWA